jgi:hypothetical protein
LPSMFCQPFLYTFSVAVNFFRIAFLLHFNSLHAFPVAVSLS